MWETGLSAKLLDFHGLRVPAKHEHSFSERGGEKGMEPEDGAPVQNALKSNGQFVLSVPPSTSSTLPVTHDDAEEAR